MRGFRRDNYNPYSIVIDGNVAANISVNKTDMVSDGVVKHFLQLGTVMTDEAYRNRGLSRSIMERIQADYNSSMFESRLYMVNNSGLIMFYAAGSMWDNVYYHKDTDTDTYGIAD